VTVLSKSARGHDRRELILRSAADLMAERGYPAVSMTQIGAAAGIVGSGVYRHFESKAMLLSALLDRVIRLMLIGTREVVAGDLTGPELLDAMIRTQSAIAIEQRSLLAVYLRDSGNLPPEDLRALRRQQRQLIEEWISQCEAVAPYAGEVQLRTVVQGVFALINSIATYDNPLPAEPLVESISTMALAALHAGLGLPTTE
jgi:AcrR family transcriptional regulator